MMSEHCNLKLHAMPEIEKMDSSDIENKLRTKARAWKWAEQERRPSISFILSKLLGPALQSNLFGDPMRRVFVRNLFLISEQS